MTDIDIIDEREALRRGTGFNLEALSNTGCSMERATELARAAGDLTTTIGVFIVIEGVKYIPMRCIEKGGRQL